MTRLSLIRAIIGWFLRMHIGLNLRAEKPPRLRRFFRQRVMELREGSPASVQSVCELLCYRAPASEAKISRMEKRAPQTTLSDAP
jgi:hypothetical protein